MMLYADGLMLRERERERERLTNTESDIEPIALYGCKVWGLLTNQEFPKWDKHQIETLHAEFCKNKQSSQWQNI